MLKSSFAAVPGRDGAKFTVFLAYKATIGKLCANGETWNDRIVICDTLLMKVEFKVAPQLGRGLKASIIIYDAKGEIISPHGLAVFSIMRHWQITRAKGKAITIDEGQSVWT